MVRRPTQTGWISPRHDGNRQRRADPDPAAPARLLPYVLLVDVSHAPLAAGGCGIQSIETLPLASDHRRIDSIDPPCLTGTKVVAWKRCETRTELALT